MKIYQAFLGLIQLAVVLSVTSPTPDDIKNCEAVTTKLHCYGQCLVLSSNCDLCEGKLSSGVCTKPTATMAACVQPGFMLNAAGDTCIDCRTEETCLLNCLGFWDLNLKTCIKGKHKTYKITNIGTLCSTLSSTDCRKCRDQKYEWSTTLLKCVKCPPGNWNATTMKCSTLSTTISAVTGQGLRTDAVYGICYTETTNKFLNLYSNACDVCPTDCSSCGAYTNCVSCATNVVASIDVSGVCECRGANYININTPTVCSTCTSTVQNCISCKSDGTCIKCSDGYGMDTTLGYCIYCAQLNTTNPFICDIPALKFCSIKSSDGFFCYQCISTDLVFDTLLKYCVCKDGKNLNLTTGQCSLCSDTLANCATCNNGVCLTCKDPNEILNATKTGCICPGFINKGTCYLCSFSSPNCKTCSSTGSSCTQCINNYGLLATSNTCYACNTIDANCITCGSTQQCLQCGNGYVLDTVKNKCVCDTSTSKRVLLNGLCITCSISINSCNTCVVNDAGTDVTCTQCQNLYISVSGVCQLCAEGYYKSSNSCIACTMTNCKSCTNTDCFTCKAGYSLSNNTCTCPSPMIIDTDGVCKTCSIKYGSLCTSCSISACTTCGGTNYTATSTGCSCVKGVDNSSAQNCIPCPSHCSSCTSDSTFTIISCTQCESGYKIMANGQCGQCPTANYYDSTTKSCKACNVNCSTCADNAGGGSCSSCSNGYTLNASAACECTSTKLLNGVNCVNCTDQYNTNCKTCDASQCLSCLDHYYFDSTKNCITCQIGQYFQQSTLSCISCPSNCSQCANLTGACTECINNYDLSVTSTCQCSKTKILNALSTCVSCSSLIQNCSECNTPNNCTVCSSDYRLMTDNKCGQCAQAQYYIPSSKTCGSCPVNCNSCKDNTAECTVSCLNNYRLDTGACVCNKDRTLKTNVCKLCSNLFSNCLECSDTQCTICASPFILTQDGCKPCKADEIYIAETMTCSQCKSLIKNCISCSSNTNCTSCVAQPFSLSSDSTACACLEGNYLIAAQANDSFDQCIPCKQFDANCLKCSGLNKCTLCSDGYAFDSTQSKCRLCLDNEFYDNRQADNVQACVNCNTFHSKCIQCPDSNKCTQCSQNFDLNELNSCSCSGNKILVANPNNQNDQICKLCSDAIDTFCELCVSTDICQKCAANYRWDAGYKRCVPEIQISITNSKQSNNALADVYNLNVVIPNSFQSAALKITIYFFHSIDAYNSEVTDLQKSQVSDEAIPFSFKNCVIFSQDNLKTLPNPKYTKVILQDGSAVLKRIDSFLLHEGLVKFVYSIESQNASFQRFSTHIDIKTQRYYKNIKEIAFAIGRTLSTQSPFTLYQIFYQFMLHKNEICTFDGQCNGNGTCSVENKMCLCNTDFNLFDCSDYVTFTYDQIIERIGKNYITSNPQTYQEKLISQTLPLLTTETAVTSSQAGVQQNLDAINQIVKNEIIDKNQLENLDNLMKNVMNSISININEISNDFTQQNIFDGIKELKSITEQLLMQFENSVDFTTSEMQLLAMINHDPAKLIQSVDVKNVFDVNYNTIGALFQPTAYKSVGLQIKILRFSFKKNPHKLSNKNFTDQPHQFPLIIYHTYKQDSTDQRILQETSPLNIFALNITFTFDVNNPDSLKNLICLTLAGENSDIEFDQYVLCPNIKILTSQVICECQNSATLFEDINYYYLANPNKESKATNNIPSSMIITIIILSMLLSALLIIQIRGIRINRSSVKLEEDYAKSKAISNAAFLKRQQQNLNPVNSEIKEFQKIPIQDSQVPPLNSSGQNKSEYSRQQETIVQLSPTILNSNQRSKRVLCNANQLNKNETSFQQNLDFQRINDFKSENKFKNEDQKLILSTFRSEKATIDINMVTTAMEQKFDDDQIENKKQRLSILQYDEEEN